MNLNFTRTEKIELTLIILFAIIYSQYHVSSPEIGARLGALTGVLIILLPVYFLYLYLYRRWKERSKINCFVFGDTTKVHI